MRKNYSNVAVIVLLGGILFVACSKDENNPTPNNNDDVSYIGSFVSSAHTTSGTAEINKDETKLSLTNFKSSTGPDLNIYLASDLSDVEGDYLDIGDMKGVAGDFTYDLPSSTDYSVYKYVVVWCVAFHVNFGYATLAPK